MRKILVLIGVVLIVLSACGGKESTATPIDVSALQTTAVQTAFAAAYQTAATNVSTDTPIPANTPVPTSTPIPTVVVIQPTVSEIPSLSLEGFPNKMVLGEDENYSVYLINSTSGDTPEKTGEIIVYDKGNNLIHQVTGSFTFFGTVRVSDDSKGEYILLSHGSYTSRQAIVISLNDKRQAVNEFCTTTGESGDHFFWNDYIIFNNCDTFKNRPWGVGEASSIVAINLKSGLVIDVAKSDLTHQFHVQAVTGDNLQYIETTVENEADWQDPAKQNTSVQTYDLLSLEN